MSRKSGKTIEAGIVRAYLPKEANDMALLEIERIADEKARADAVEARILAEQERTLSKPYSARSIEEKKHTTRIENAKNKMNSEGE